MFIPTAWYPPDVTNALCLRPERFADHYLCIGCELESWCAGDCGYDACMRREIVDSLWKAQRIYEDEIGEPVCERYYCEEHRWDCDYGQIALDHRWIEGFLRQQREVIATLPINYWIAEEIFPVQQPDGTYELRISDSDGVLDGVDPYALELYGTLAQKFLHMDQFLRGGASNWPRFDEDTLEWVWSFSSQQGGRAINLFQCERVHVSVPAPACAVENIVLQYPGREQIIYTADMPVEVDPETGDVRIYINCCRLLDPRFATNNQSFCLPEGWSKRLRTVDVVCVTDVPALIELLAFPDPCPDDCDPCDETQSAGPCEVVVSYACGRIISRERSLIEIQPVTLSGDVMSADCGMCGGYVEPCSTFRPGYTPTMARIYYKVSPPEGCEGDFPQHEEAIARLAASMLDYQKCVCESRSIPAFVVNARRPLGSLREGEQYLVFPTESVPMRFGRTEGGGFAFSVSLKFAKSHNRVRWVGRSF